jgi:hypothetical protein
MAWYWYLAIVCLIFNIGFVCGTWVGGSRANGQLRMKGLVARFIHAETPSEKDLQVQKVSA